MFSLIVLSSDGYSECWDPLFYLFKKNFERIDKSEIILSTNTKDYEFPGLKVNILKHGNKMSWSKRLRLSVEKAKNEIVFVLVEDFFLTKKIDTNIFDELLRQIKSNPKIDHIRFLLTQDRTETLPSDIPFLDVIHRKARLRFTYLPGLWKKDILLKYVRDKETPYLSERLGDYRSYIFKDGFYSISKDYIEENGQFYNCPPSGAIFKGRWSVWVKKFIKEEKIQGLDFEKRGFVDEDFCKGISLRNKLNLLKDPIPTFFAFFSVFKLYIKQSLKYK